MVRLIQLEQFSLRIQGYQTLATPSASYFRPLALGTQIFLPDILLMRQEGFSGLGDAEIVGLAQEAGRFHGFGDAEAFLSISLKRQEGFDQRPKPLFTSVTR